MKRLARIVWVTMWPLACVGGGGTITPATDAMTGSSTAPSMPGQGNGSGTVSTGSPVGADFVPVSANVAARRVKNLLSGGVPTAAEYSALDTDPAKMAALVDAWMATPAYTQKMELFWHDAFEQSQAVGEDFHLSLNELWFTPKDELLLNYRQSFGKTVTALVKEGRPFNEVATTRRFMMTTAMMMDYAYSDSVMVGDNPARGKEGPRKIRNMMVNGDWNCVLTNKGGPISLSDSANPSSANYLRFYIPVIGNAARYNDGEGTANFCAQSDPVLMNNASSFEGGWGVGRWLYAALIGDTWRYFSPPQGQPNAKFCEVRPSPAVLTDNDYNDWRMVTIAAPTSEAQRTQFYDVAGIRNSSKLYIFSPRVGYFTTPSFFSQWNTNVSNQARTAANQMLITGLGHAVDGQLGVKLINPPGLDSAHSAEPACMACHITLDPLRQFYRQNFSLGFSAQLDPKQQEMPGTFGFDGVTQSSSSMDMLGQTIATHPRFKIAWAQKLCNWAISATCDIDDPELMRIANLFEQNNYSWPTLVKAMFTSPLVTYLGPTQTSRHVGAFAPIMRRGHFCAALDARLGLDDVCGLTQLQNGGRGTDFANAAYSVPADHYSRGAVDPIYVANPDLFYRNVVENICALAAGQVVDAKGTDAYSSQTPKAAVDSIVHDLLGLDGTRDAAIARILMAHYDRAVASGRSPNVALQSTFTLACTSPYMTSLGQ